MVVEKTKPKYSLVEERKNEIIEQLNELSYRDQLDIQKIIERRAFLSKGNGSANETEAISYCQDGKYHVLTKKLRKNTENS